MKWIDYIWPIYQITFDIHNELDNLEHFNDFESSRISHLYWDPEFPTTRHHEIESWSRFYEIYYFKTQQKLFYIEEDNNHFDKSKSYTYDVHFFDNFYKLLNCFKVGAEITDETMASVIAKVTLLNTHRANDQAYRDLVKMKKELKTAVDAINVQINLIKNKCQKSTAAELIESFNVLVTMSNEFRVKWTLFETMVNYFVNNFRTTVSLKKDIGVAINRVLDNILKKNSGLLGRLFSGLTSKRG